MNMHDNNRECFNYGKLALIPDEVGHDTLCSNL